MIHDRRAKITATLEPASFDPQTIRRLFEAGVDVFRLKFSHGGHSHEEMVDQENGIGAPGDTVIIVGIPFSQAGSTNIPRIVTL